MTTDPSSGSNVPPSLSTQLRCSCVRAVRCVRDFVKGAIICGACGLAIAANAGPDLDSGPAQDFAEALSKITALSSGPTDSPGVIQVEVVAGEPLVVDLNQIYREELRPAEVRSASGSIHFGPVFRVKST